MQPLFRAAEPALLPSDEELLGRGHWTDDVQRDLLWQFECLQVLLWAVNKLPEIPAADVQADPIPLIGHIVEMSAGPEQWLRTLSLRQCGELDKLDSRTELWLWRTRSCARRGRRLLPPFVKEAVDGALRRGLISADESVSGDLLAFSKPVFQLDAEQVDELRSIATERFRATRWLWCDFDDWWDPVLTT
jgi:hypothetical protein